MSAVVPSRLAVFAGLVSAMNTAVVVSEWTEEVEVVFELVRSLVALEN